MKKSTLTLLAIACTLASYAQTGATCNDAIPESANTTCNFTTYTTCCLEMWFSFTATGSDVSIVLQNQAAFGTNAPHAHSITLFSGICANLNQLEEDELPFLNPAAELTIDASGLSIGNTYFIRVQREAIGAIVCDKGACFPVIQNATFALCIEDIDVFIPLDFNLNNFGFLERPISTHIYYTNKGQRIDTDGNPRLDIKSYTIGSSPAVYVTDTSVSYVYARVDTSTFTLDTMHRVDMKLAGGNQAARIFRTEKTPGHLNYYLGHIPTGITKMKGYNRAVCNNVYPNIDMQYYSNSEGLKYYFIVHPGGDADNIVMRFEGANSIDVTGNGGLRVSTALGNIEFEAGHAYQKNPSIPNTINPMPWQAEFVKVSANEVKFDIRNYPKNKPLIIQVDRGHQLGSAGAINNLLLSTYWGGTAVAIDVFQDITTDTFGNVYIAGRSGSADFPVGTGILIDTLAGGIDAIVIKLNNIWEPQWVIFYGGSVGGASWDFAHSIAIDSVGNVYIAGRTESSDFPTFASGSMYIDSVNNCTTGSCLDLFIVKFDNNGIRLWATYYGEDDVEEYAEDIVIDGNGNLYVVGRGNSSTDLFIQPGAFNDTLGSGLLLKFLLNGERKWVTLYGGTGGDEQIKGIAKDANNNIFITGRTKGGTDFPILNPGGNAVHAGPSNGFDAFIARFDVNNVLTTSSFYGGGGAFFDTDNGQDIGNSIAVDASGNVYVLGTTNSYDTINNPFPLVAPPSGFFQSTFNDPFGTGQRPLEAFLLMLDNSGAVLYATFYGGNWIEEATKITIDANGYIYIFGRSKSGTVSPSPELSGGPKIPFPNQNPANFYLQDDLRDDAGLDGDGYLAVFSPNLDLVWTTYFGSGKQGPGGNAEIILGATTFGSSDLYIIGEVLNGSDIFPDFPTVDFNINNPDDYFLDSTVGFGHAFAARFDITGVVSIPIVINEDIAVINEFTVFPNPSSGEITLQFNFEHRKSIDISIYDMIGREVINKKYKNLNRNVSKTLKLSELSRGMYLLKVISEEKNIKTVKLILH